MIGCSGKVSVPPRVEKWLVWIEDIEKYKIWLICSNCAVWKFLKKKTTKKWNKKKGKKFLDTNDKHIKFIKHNFPPVVFWVNFLSKFWLTDSRVKSATSLNSFNPQPHVMENEEIALFNDRFNDGKQKKNILPFATWAGIGDGHWRALALLAFELREFDVADNGRSKDEQRCKM